MKKDLKESLAKMRYLAGLITESQLNEFYKEDEYFADDKEGFSVDSPDAVEGLFHSLKFDGVADFKFYPDWVFNALQEEGMIEQEEGGSWFLSQLGKSQLRDSSKLQQFLMDRDEDTTAVDLENEGIEGRPGNYSPDKKLEEIDGEINVPNIKQLKNEFDSLDEISQFKWLLKHQDIIDHVATESYESYIKFTIKGIKVKSDNEIFNFKANTNKSVEILLKMLGAKNINFVDN